VGNKLDAVSYTPSSYSIGSFLELNQVRSPHGGRDFLPFRDKARNRTFFEHLGPFFFDPPLFFALISRHYFAKAVSIANYQIRFL
jgi:hypothetical protein